MAAIGGDGLPAVIGSGWDVLGPVASWGHSALGHALGHAFAGDPWSAGALLGQSLSGHFAALDWVVMVGYLALVSVLGVWLAGKQVDMEDFFRGGNKLPWYAVSASMIATIISAVTFVGVPSIAYAQSGNFTYLQFGIIAGLLSRLFVSFVLVPAYYKHRVYSPYDYMGLQLGESARSVTTAMFSLMGLLAQASRVYLTAIVLELVLREPLHALESASGVPSIAWSVGLVGLIAITWTMLGGIATVIWTDAMLFLVFLLGGLVALGVIAYDMPGGLGQVLTQGWEAEKFKLWTLFEETGDSPYATVWGEVFARPYTLWAAIFAVTFGNIGAYGTDQLLAQRIFTCRNETSAKVAVMSSWAAELVAGLMLLVGVGLWAYYREFPEALSGEAAAAVAENRDNIFPVFILTQVPVGLTGLIVAGIFAAAISSLTSILAALAQTTLSAVYLPIRGIDASARLDAARNRELILVSRGMIVVWGVALCAMAMAIDWYVRAQEASGEPVYFLDLALGLASYVIGSLFAAFLLAWLPLKINAHGLIWAAPLSILTVFASRYHDTPLPNSLVEFLTAGPLSTFWALRLCALAGLVLLATWLVAALTAADTARRNTRLLQTGWLLVGVGLMLYVTAFGYFEGVPDPETGEVAKHAIAWPWYAPIGGFVAFVFGYLLADRRDRTPTLVAATTGAGTGTAPSTSEPPTTPPTTPPTEPDRA